MDETIDTIANRVKEELAKHGFTIVSTDLTRPWGGFYQIASDQAAAFIKTYFSGITLPNTSQDATLSPKIMMVKPGTRLSWQVHERRGEFWRVLEGPVAAALGPTDDQPEPRNYQPGEIIDIPQGTRHRLCGLDTWGTVAEIWIHSDANHPSDEQDIRRIADDFGRLG